MKNLYLNYYKNFACISTSCKHNCCIGWQIGIDKKSLRSYKRAKGDFGVKLKNGIDFSNKNFRLGENKRCVFLKENNLCEIICTLGEKSLCQTCADHPRFRNFFGGYTETGLGFCCEEACRIILSQTEKISIENPQKPMRVAKKDRFVLESREKVLSILQNREKTFSERIIEIINSFEPIIYKTEKDWQRWIDFLKTLDILEESWLNKLTRLNLQHFEKTDYEKILNANTLVLEQFMVNTIYRHYSSANIENQMGVKISFALFALYLIINLCAMANDFTFETLCEQVRSFSAELEYSDTNLNKIYDKIEGDLFLKNI